MSLPTVAQLKKALSLAQKLEKLQDELSSLIGDVTPGLASSAKAEKAPRKTRQMSAEGRKRIAEAQKKRWAAKKKAEKAAAKAGA